MKPLDGKNQSHGIHGVKTKAARPCFIMFYFNAIYSEAENGIVNFTVNHIFKKSNKTKGWSSLFRSHGCYRVDFCHPEGLGGPPMASQLLSPPSTSLPPFALCLALFSSLKGGSSPKGLSSPSVATIGISTRLPFLPSPLSFPFQFSLSPCFCLLVGSGPIWSNMGAYRPRPPVNWHRSGSESVNLVYDPSSLLLSP